MKEITLQKAYALLENCNAVIWGDDYLSYPSLSKLTGEDNQFMSLDDGSISFYEEENKVVKISGSSMFLIDAEGDETQLNLLTIINLDNIESINSNS